MESFFRMHGGTAMEVRKNTKSTTWYNAMLMDVKGGEITVSFEDDIWPTRQVPASSVRHCPEEPDDFEPEVDEVVEVQVSASESNPSGWSLGTVKTIKNSFYFISFTGTQKSQRDLIVEKAALRRLSNEQPLDIASTIRRSLKVHVELKGWVKSQDSLGCLKDVQQRCRLLVANCITEESGSEKDPQILLVGDERSVDLGSKLLEDIHFKYQIEMQRFHEQREKLMERLSTQRSWYTDQHKEVFTVESALVGRLIGKKGENINDIRERHGVQVGIQDPDAYSQRQLTTVTVTGQTAESAKAARDDLEFITVSIPLEQEQVGWILGKGYQTITDIARKTELHHARYDNKSQCLELCGLRHQVEDAKLLISVHREYLPVYKDMDEEKQAINESFEQLDSGPSKGKGKKGSKGGDDASKGGKEKEGKAGKDGKGGKDSKGSKDGSESHGGKGSKGSKDGSESHGGKDSKGSKGSKDGSESHGGKDSKGKREGKDGKGGKEGADFKGEKGGKDSKGYGGKGDGKNLKKGGKG